MTTIYQYDTSLNHTMIAVLSMIIIVLIGVGVRVVLVPLIRGERDEHGHRINYKDIPLTQKLIFQLVPTIIILVACLGLGNLIKGYAGFELQMSDGDYTNWRGDPEIVSYEENWYRDSFLGYQVTLMLDEVEFTPADSFSMEVIKLFESDTEMTICYGYMDDELFVWSITTEESLTQ